MTMLLRRRLAHAGGAILPVAVAVAVHPHVEIAGRAKLGEVGDRLRADEDLHGQHRRLAVGQVPQPQVRAVVAAIVVRVVGRRDDVVERVLIRADIRLGFQADALAQVEGTRVRVARSLRLAGGRVEDGREVGRHACVGSHWRRGMVRAVRRVAQVAGAHLDLYRRQRAVQVGVLLRIGARAAGIGHEAEGQRAAGRVVVGQREFVRKLALHAQDEVDQLGFVGQQADDSQA